jgi:hypothetical protein
MRRIGLRSVFCILCAALVSASALAQAPQVLGIQIPTISSEWTDPNGGNWTFLIPTVATVGTLTYTPNPGQVTTGKDALLPYEGGSILFKSDQFTLQQIAGHQEVYRNGVTTGAWALALHAISGGLYMVDGSWRWYSWNGAGWSPASSQP